MASIVWLNKNEQRWVQQSPNTKRNFQVFYSSMRVNKKNKTKPKKETKPAWFSQSLLMEFNLILDYASEKYKVITHEPTLTFWHPTNLQDTVGIYKPKAFVNPGETSVSLKVFFFF